MDCMICGKEVEWKKTEPLTYVAEWTDETKKTLKGIMHDTCNNAYMKGYTQGRIDATTVNFIMPKDEPLRDQHGNLLDEKITFTMPKKEE